MSNGQLIVTKEPSKEIYISSNKFEKHVSVEIITNTSSDDNLLKFKVRNAPQCFHDAIRKTILCDVPSVAVSKIFMLYNTGMIDDVDLNKSIALVPIDVNPSLLKDVQDHIPLPNINNINKYDAETMLLFKLNVESGLASEEELCKRLVQHLDDKSAAQVLAAKYNKYGIRQVISDDLKWEPLGEQKDTIVGGCEFVPGVMLSTLNCKFNDAMVLECLAARGYGWDHAKYIPATNVNVRPQLVPKITGKVTRDDTDTLLKLFPEGVFKKVKKRAVVNNIDLMDRPNFNWKKYPALADKISFEIDESEFMWELESLRPKNQPAQKIFEQALDIIIEKCKVYANAIRQLMWRPVLEPIDFKKRISGKDRYVVNIRNDNPDFSRYVFHGESGAIVDMIANMIQSLNGDFMQCGRIPGDEIVLVLEIPPVLEYNQNDVLIDAFETVADYLSIIKVKFQQAMIHFTETRSIE